MNDMGRVESIMKAAFAVVDKPEGERGETAWKTIRQEAQKDRGASEATPERGAVVLDIAGRRVDLDPCEAMRLRDVASDRAGRSSAARDLSLLLDRALSRDQVLTLRRAEAHTLGLLARAVGLAEVAGELTSPKGRPAPAHGHWSSSEATTIRS
jgi:hypothetical protein